MSDLDFLFGSGGLDSVVATAQWGEPAGRVARALGLTEAAETLGADAAFVPEGAGRAWLVANGSIDLFFLEGKAAIRRHVLRVEEGQMLCVPAGDARLLAVPSNGAMVVETKRADVIAVARDARHEAAERNAAVQAVALWALAVLRAAVEGPPPTDLQMLDAGQRAEVTAGTPVGVQHGLLWLLADDGFPEWPEPVDRSPPSRFRPVAPGTWLVPRADAETVPLSVGEWLAGASVQADLEALEIYAAERVAKRAAERRRREAEAMGASRGVRQAAFSRAMAGLVSVFSRAPGGGTPLPEEPTAAAAAIAWRAQGMPRALGRAAQRRIAAATDKPGAVAQESGLFMRKVALTGPWWRDDHGPLLGHYGQDGAPCALLPRGRSGYRLVDTQTGRDQPVTPEVARSVADTAFSFAEPLPEGRIGARRLLSFGFRNGGADMRIVGLMALLTGLLSLATPLVTGWIMDPVIPEAQTDQLAVLIAALVVAAAASTGFGLVQAIGMLRLEGRMANRVQTAVWDRLLRLPASFFRSYAIGDLANRAQGVDSMRSMLTGSVTTSLLHAIAGLFSLGLMFWYGWRLAAVALLFALLYGLIVILIGRRILAHNRETMYLTGRIQGLVLQLLNAVAKLRVAGAETSAFGRWAAPYAELISATYHQQRMNTWLITFKSGFHFFAITAVVAILALQSHELFAIFRTPTTWTELDANPLHKIMPTAHFVAFHVAFGQFMAAAFGLSQTLVKISAVKPLYERVEPILDADPEPDTGADDPGELHGGLELRDLRFRYAPDAPLVLDGLTLEAKPGEFIALVGPSGAGKSTLVRLLLAFDVPESGSIFLDGQDLARLNKRLVRRQLGVVLQDGRLLSGSLFHNITAGANLTREDAMEAARLAGLDKDIEKMPMGMETYLGEGASTLSGGQRQRLMIARALVRRPRILIFDEATSALDNETQEIVTKGVERLNATRVVIAHRLSTIVHADRIFVLGGGKVVESGTYDELMAKKGAFAELARRQLA